MNIYIIQWRHLTFNCDSMLDKGKSQMHTLEWQINGSNALLIHFYLCDRRWNICFHAWKKMEIILASVKINCRPVIHYFCSTKDDWFRALRHLWWQIWYIGRNIYSSSVVVKYFPCQWIFVALCFLLSQIWTSFHR